MMKIKTLNVDVNITEEIYLIKCFLPLSIETGSLPPQLDFRLTFTHTNLQQLYLLF
jgi:hypothetical protein